MHKRSLSILEAFITFAVAGCWFFALVVFLLPKLQCIPRINSAVTWFITGYLVFIPLLLYAIVRVVNEGNRGFSDILSSLAFKPMTKKDWLYALIGTVVAFAGTGLVYGLSIVATRVIGIRAISPSPWFMTIEPFYGYTRLLLLVWFPMFLCNIFGEEIVWRGYIQNRMPHQYSWIVNGLFWGVFHIVFGLDLLVLLIPCLILVPYAFSKTRNTWVTVLIHGLYNGPAFVFIALGIL